MIRNLLTGEPVEIDREPLTENTPVITRLIQVQTQTDQTLITEEILIQGTQIVIEVQVLIIDRTATGVQVLVVQTIEAQVLLVRDPAILVEADQVGQAPDQHQAALEAAVVEEVINN